MIKKTIFIRLEVVPGQLAILSAKFFTVVASDCDLGVERIVRVDHQREDCLVNLPVFVQLLKEESRGDVMCVGVGTRCQSDNAICLQPIETFLDDHIGEGSAGTHCALAVQAYLVFSLEPKN